MVHMPYCDVTIAFELVLYLLQLYENEHLIRLLPIIIIIFITFFNIILIFSSYCFTQYGHTIIYYIQL